MLSLPFLARKPLLHRRRRIALLGMFRSGTNYTRTLLETHYDVEVAYNLLGWKHGLLPTFAPRSGMQLPDARPLVVVKHPLAFLRSVYRYHAETGCDMHTQADGWPDFAIRQLTPHAGERFVIQYIEPVANNRAAVGIDVASEDNRRSAALQALRTASAVITDPITLVQADGKKNQGFLILLPVFVLLGTALPLLSY